MEEDFRVTEETREYESYIRDKWGKHFYTDIEVPVRKLFPEPKNVGLRHIWKYGSADLVVYDHSNHMICVIEPGGASHMQDEKQMRNDRRKFMLCKLNGIKMLSVMNGVKDGLSKRRFRKLLGSYLFGENVCV